jgi:hypothetical protein
MAFPVLAALSIAQAFLGGNKNQGQSGFDPTFNNRMPDKQPQFQLPPVPLLQPASGGTAVYPGMYGNDTTKPSVGSDITRAFLTNAATAVAQGIFGGNRQQVQYTPPSFR